jgi:predicted nucleic acid-binding protein
VQLELGFVLYLLDSCAIQRPLDVFTVLRNKLEAEAVLGIIGYCDAGTITLVSSEALEYEMEQNVLSVRKEHVQAVLAKANVVAQVEPAVEQRAATFVKRGIKPMDAVHVASAEAAGVDYFCSCDDRLVRKLKRMRDLKITPLSPLELIEELEP